MAAGPWISRNREPAVPRGWPGPHCPNFSDWSRGDIVLVHRQVNWRGYATHLGQLLSLNPLMRAGSICSHAAIYIGNGRLIDSTYGELIDERSVWTYCQHRALQVRRLKPDPAVTPADILEIATAAETFAVGPVTSRAYDLLEIVISKLVPGVVPDRDALYCSTLVGMAVGDATGVDLSSDPSHRPLYPSILLGHPQLEDVMLEWRSL